VRRWHEQWERSKTRELPEIDEVIRRLRNALPESPAPTIVHGDYRLGNMMMDFNEPGRVVAILDWEMATLGDPLADLGYTLLYWTEPGDPPEAIAGSMVTTHPGFASRAEIVEEYARLTGRDVTHVDFYQVLAAYKLAVIIEGIHARFLAGETVGEGFEGYDERAAHLVNRALMLADESSDPKLRGE
jgi:aminoglycoside phosphotransferase (APT) family kinase protein